MIYTYFTSCEHNSIVKERNVVDVRNLFFYVISVFLICLIIILRIYKCYI